MAICWIQSSTGPLHQSASTGSLFQSASTGSLFQSAWAGSLFQSAAPVPLFQSASPYPLFQSASPKPLFQSASPNPRSCHTSCKDPTLHEFMENSKPSIQNPHVWGAIRGTFSICFPALLKALTENGDAATARTSRWNRNNRE